MTLDHEKLTLIGLALILVPMALGGICSIISFISEKFGKLFDS